MRTDRAAVRLRYSQQCRKRPGPCHRRPCWPWRV